MSTPWLFSPNCKGKIWYNQIGMPGGPPTYNDLPCQQMKPWFNPTFTPSNWIHRFIFRVSDTGSATPTSTDVANGLVVYIADSIGVDNSYWYVVNDVSIFPFDDGAGNLTWKVFMFACTLATY